MGKLIQNYKGFKIREPNRESNSKTTVLQVFAKPIFDEILVRRFKYIRGDAKDRGRALAEAWKYIDRNE